MQTHRLLPHVFNSCARRVYAILKLYPQYRDFIDGRANTVFDTRFLRDCFRIYDAVPEYEKLLRHQLMLVILAAYVRVVIG